MNLFNKYELVALLTILFVISIFLAAFIYIDQLEEHPPEGSKLVLTQLS